MSTRDDSRLSVPAEQWRQAQAWEQAAWETENPAPSRRERLRGAALRALGRRAPCRDDDWNHWWAERFDHYRALPAAFENAVELGCGPYTNVRVICRERQVGHLFCSDPLVRRYVGFHGTWLAEAWRRGEVLVDDHPVEECPFASGYFDLVVMINVLDHVRDARLGIEHAARIVKPGGYLVLGQDLTNAEDLQNPEVRDDIGHPIRVHHQVLDEALLPRFEPRIHRVLGREEGRNPAAHYGTYLFIGTKR